MLERGHFNPISVISKFQILLIIFIIHEFVTWRNVSYVIHVTVLFWIKLIVFILPHEDSYWRKTISMLQCLSDLNFKVYISKGQFPIWVWFHMTIATRVFHKVLILKTAWEYILVRNHFHVIIVRRAFSKEIILQHIREYTLGRSHFHVIIVRRAFSKEIVL